MKAAPYQPLPAALAERFAQWIENGEAGAGALREQRRMALALFLKTGLPTRSVEAWKYTDTAFLGNTAWRLPLPPASGPPPSPALTSTLAAMTQPDDYRLVFINGHYRPGLSTPDDTGAVSAVSLRASADAEALADLPGCTNLQMESPFVLLNRALWSDGILLRIAARQIVPARIHLLMLHPPEGHPDLLTVPRILVTAGEQCEAELAVSYASLGPGTCLNLPCLDIDVQAGARLTLCQTQALDEGAFHVAATRIHQQRDSHVCALEAAFGSAFARHNLSASLDGEGAEVELNGIYTLQAKQLNDFHTVIEHRQPNCRSRQVYKGILHDRATAVFNGAVRVHPGASGTDGYQLNRTLLRSGEAKIFTKPELEIDNDDVRCSHGATIGQLDPAQVFYLQSRGITTDKAENLLSRGFVEDLIFQFPSPRQRNELDVHLDRYFNRLQEP